MAKAVSQLKALRKAAGLSQRELARIIGLDSSNISFWEAKGKIPRSDVLLPIANALGVTIEELLGQPTTQRIKPAGGRLSQIFEKVTKLPRRQQTKIADVIEALVDRAASKDEE